MEPTQKDVSNLSELCAASGIIKRPKEGGYVPIKIAYHPYKTSQECYRLVQSVTKVWQKLICRAYHDTQLYERVYKYVCCEDPVICFLLKLKKQQNEQLVPFVYNFVRCDYFIDRNGLPKLIQYNLESVSMSAHAQNIQMAKRLSDFDNAHKYFENTPNEHFTESISKLYKEEGVNGTFLFVVQEKEVNVVEQRLIQLSLLRHNIKVEMINFKDLGKGISKDEDNNLRLGNQKIGVVYFRSGYKFEEYQCDLKGLLKARELIEYSNAVKIPDARMKLLNSKRMQTELSKESVYSRYLTKEEGELLRLSIIGQWEFDDMKEQQFGQLLKRVEQDRTRFILKPNCEGGGNNIFGEKVYEVLKISKAEERKMYILMQKIQTDPRQNVLINGSLLEKAACDYEVSNYGIVFGKNKEIVRNDVVGHLVRVKPITLNEGGIMSGQGSLCSWMRDDAEEK